MTNEHIVKEGVYIPETGIDYPEIPDQQILVKEIQRKVVVDENYPFFDKSLYGRSQSLFTYLAWYFAAAPLNRIRYGFKVEGKKNLKKNKKLLKNGCVTICNHVYRWDFVGILDACRLRKMFVLVKTDNLGGKDEYIVRGIGGIPIPDSGLAATRKFNQTLDWLHSKKKWIHIFPESTRWEYYQPIRPFKKGPFLYAQKWGVPVIPMVITYRPAKGFIREKIMKTNHPLITLHIGEPMLFDETLSRKESINDMRKRCHEKMVEMAGIVKNGWDCEGD